MPFPRIVLIGGGVAALLLAPLLFISPPPAEEGEAEATGAPITPELEREILAREEALRGDDDLSRHLLDFKVQRARPLPEEAYGRFLDALDERHERRLDRVSLRLYGELLDLQARRGLRAPELGTRLMRLRHAALLLGDRSFLDRVAGSVMTYSRLDERLEGLEGHGEHDPGFELAAAHHAILTEHWDAALEALESVLSSDGVAPRQDSWEALAEGLAAARTLARVAGSAPSARAQELLEELLAPGSLEGRYGLDREQAARVGDWLRGAQRLHRARAEDRPGPEGLDGGAAILARALAAGRRQGGVAGPGTPEGEGGRRAAPWELAIAIDLAEALRLEANRRASRLLGEGSPSALVRERQLYLIGWGAARRGDQEELAEVLAHLNEIPVPEADQAYSRLLRAAGMILAGNPEEGVRRIRAEIASGGPALRQGERRLWKEVAESSRFPEEEPGQLLFQNAKLWAELGEGGRPWFRRAVELLRAQISGPRDLAYLTFLEARLAYRSGDLEGVAARLLELLERGPPPGLSRGEIAALLVLVEEREEELAEIAERRRLATELCSRAREEEKDHPASALLGRILACQVRLDGAAGEYLVSDEGGAELGAIAGALDRPWLGFPLEEKWLELREDLLSLAGRLRAAGDLDGALAALGHFRGLVRDLPLHREEEARILAAQASRLPPEEQEAARRLWRRAGDAFRDGASAEDGEHELFLEAAESYMEAAEAALAKQSLGDYIGNRTRGEGDDAPYWRAQLYGVRIERELGHHEEALRICNGNIDASDIPRDKQIPFYLERGLCLEELGREGEALADYERTGNLLLPASAAWRTALFRKALILEGRARGMAAEGAPARARRAEALAVWRELASWLRTDEEDSRLAVALFHVGDDSLELSDLAGARASFLELLGRDEAFRALSLVPAERQRWSRFVEKALFRLADTLFQEGRYQQAAERYAEALKRHPRSSLLPWGYSRLAECMVRRNLEEEARRTLLEGMRRVQELPAETVEGLPPGGGQEYWLKSFQERIRVLGGSALLQR